MQRKIGPITLVTICVAILRGIWQAVGHWGNFQTVKDIVKDWPVILQNCALVLTSWWFPVTIAIACLGVWALLERRSRTFTEMSQTSPSTPPVQNETLPLTPPVQNETIATNVNGNLASASAGRDVHQTFYHGQSSHPLSTDGPNPRIVALDDLKELLREGDEMLNDFDLGKWELHSLAKVDDYIDRARHCVRRGVLEVPGGDWLRFEQPWDLDESLSLANSLCTAKLLPDILKHPDATSAFCRLHGRVERLRELLKALTGVDIESPYIGAPAPYSQKRAMDDAGPSVVPPKSSEAERHEKLGQITLQRSGERIIKSVESVLSEVNRHLNKYKSLLEQFAKDHSLPEHTHAPNVPPLLEVEDDLIKNCVAVESQTGGAAFRALGQELLGLKEAVTKFNAARNAMNMHGVFRWSQQTIPAAITQARVEWSTRPS